MRTLTPRNQYLYNKNLHLKCRFFSFRENSNNEEITYNHFNGWFLAASAQADFNNVLAAGLEDAEKFTTDYIGPLSEGAVYNMSSGWYNTADSKPLGGFEISLVGNISGFKNKQDKKTFILGS